MKRSEQVGELVAALVKAQAEFTPAVKDSDNPYYNSKYADLNAVINAVRPALNKNGIAMMHSLESDLERQVAIVTVGLYCGEQFMEIEVEAPATGRAKKNEQQDGVGPTKFDVQTIGAAWTYLRRYSLQAICGLASEDDDGNTLQNNNKPIARRTTPAQAMARQNHSVQPDFEPDLPSEVQPPPAASLEASQSRVGPTKRIPPTPPENVPGLLCTVKRIKESPKKGNVNANISVVLDEVLNGSNQGVAWVCSYVTCWHASLFDVLRKSVGKECQFHIKERDAKLNNSDEWPTHFIDIEDVISVSDPKTGDYTEYTEGKPVPAQQ